MERTYVIPLRKAFMKTPSYNRTNRAVREVQIFLKHHMKTETVKMGEELNKALWARGDSKPPARVTVLCKKEDDVVYAELVGTDFAKKDFSEEALKEAAEKKPKKAPAKETTPKADKKKAEKTEDVAPLDDSGVADPAELIGKAATAKAKAEGKVAADKKAKK